MNYSLVKQVITLLEEYESQHSLPNDEPNLKGFRQWIHDQVRDEQQVDEPDWEGKQNGRSPESVINQLIVHMNRYAKTYSKSAIHGSPISTQEDFIYLINLKVFGAMGKMELIKRNIQEKPAGMKIINRLIEKGWVEQSESTADKRSRVLRLTESGIKTLELQMQNIRKATLIVTGDLTHYEKMELIRLLKKLERFHKIIYSKNLHNDKLLDAVMKEYYPKSIIQ